MTARAAVLVSLVALAFGCSRSNDTVPSPQARSSPAPGPAPTVGVDASAPTDAGRDAALAGGSLHHVLGTGQSLASGYGGTPALSTTQPYDNRMFNTGVLAGGTGLTAFVPLVETGMETMSSSFTGLITKLARDAGKSHDLLVSVNAVGGAPYRIMKKGTAPYAVGIAEVSAGFAIARANGTAYEVSAVTSADGGGDHVDKNTHYAEDLAQWQRDYEADSRAITGQATSIPFFLTQYSSWTEYDPTSPIPIAQLRSAVDNPGKVVMVGPRYVFPYGPDGVHLTNVGYRVMGEYYARAYKRVVVEHGTWEPLRPKTITRTTNVITVKLLVPAPPLVFDTTLATNPGNMGFEYVDDGPASPTITSVALAGADSVTITLSAEPTAANKRLRYAYTGTQGALAGLQTGAHGNLRDSDATPSRYGFALYDWCVHFDEPVP